MTSDERAAIAKLIRRTYFVIYGERGGLLEDATTHLQSLFRKIDEDDEEPTVRLTIKKSIEEAKDRVRYDFFATMAERDYISISNKRNIADLADPSLSGFHFCLFSEEEFEHAKEKIVEGSISFTSSICDIENLLSRMDVLSSKKENCTIVVSKSPIEKDLILLMSKVKVSNPSFANYFNKLKFGQTIRIDGQNDFKINDYTDTFKHNLEFSKFEMSIAKKILEGLDVERSKTLKCNIQSFVPGVNFSKMSSSTGQTSSKSTTISAQEIRSISFSAGETDELSDERELDIHFDSYFLTNAAKLIYSQMSGQVLTHSKNVSFHNLLFFVSTIGSKDQENKSDSIISGVSIPITYSSCLVTIFSTISKAKIMLFESEIELKMKEAKTKRYIKIPSATMSNMLKISTVEGSSPSTEFRVYNSIIKYKDVNLGKVKSDINNEPILISFGEIFDKTFDKDSVPELLIIDENIKTVRASYSTNQKKEKIIFSLIEK